MTTPTQKQSETLEWEFFFDEAYFDKWAVRPIGDTSFNSQKLFHLPSKEEAEALCDTLNARAQPSETPVAEKVRDILMRFQSQIASSPIGRAGSDVLYTVKHNERDREELREALALLDAQSAPLEDGEKEIDLSGLMAGTHKVVPVEHDLTELLSFVKEMKQVPYNCGLNCYQNRRVRSVSAACDKIIAEIEKMMAVE